MGGFQESIYLVSKTGGPSERIPVPYGTVAAISPDGVWMAYTLHTTDNRTWKRYRGGMATDIWLFNLKDHSSKKITDWEGTDSIPMWSGKTIFYMSDQGPSHRLNIWSYDTASGKRKQITEFSDYDVKWPSISPKGEIIFQHGSHLMLLDPAAGSSHAIDVVIPGDRPKLLPRTIDTSRYIGAWDVSPSGKRAVLEARGDIWTAPAKDGSPRNLTGTSGVAERDPTWSPDGRWIAYFSDVTGEYELYITQSDGMGETKQLTKDSTPYKFAPSWAPNSKNIVFTDKAGNLYLTDVATGSKKLLDRDPQGQQLRPSWSHDSRWLAYGKTDDRLISGTVWICNVETGEKKQVTSGLFMDGSPAFDKKGDYLYFSSIRRFSPSYDDLGVTWVYNQGAVLVAVPLRKDMKSPYLPKSDEENWKEKDKKDEPKKDEPKGEVTKDDGLSGTWTGQASGGPLPAAMEITFTIMLSSEGSVSGSLVSAAGTAQLSNGHWDTASKTLTGTLTMGGESAQLTATISGEEMTGTVTGPDFGTVQFTAARTSKAGGGAPGVATASGGARDKVDIDFDGFEQRAIMLPVQPGGFGNLAVNDKGALLYVRNSPTGGPSIQMFDINDVKREEKTVAAGAGSYAMTADGKKIIIIRGMSATIQDAGPGSGDNVVTTGMNVSIDPRQEWKQMYVDAWRLERDFFYDPNMHGVNWPKVREQYMPMIEDCNSREDVGFVISEMIAELNVGHAYYGGGDTEGSATLSVGLLGADYALENGSWRIKRILQGGPWDLDSRGPLSQSGVDIKAGDYVLAVNGKTIPTDRDIWAAFQGLAGRTITLTVSDKPTKDSSARDIVIRPIPTEGDLRYRAWVEQNRAYVEKVTNGQVGYIHVPDTGTDGQNELYRQFLGQTGKAALIIDERWNGGGQVPDRFVELLNRPALNYFATRDGKDGIWPLIAHHGPKCMLINGLAGSGGDAFPSYFKQAGVGKLIGTRTWGGLVGLSGNPGLIDGAVVTVPTFGYYKLNGTWGIEGHGVDPDMEVVDDPAKMWNGGDPQLDAAIQWMLEEVKRHPFTPTPKPKYPDRSGMGIKPEDR